MDIRAAEISAILKEQIKNFGREAEVSEVGQVLSVGDGIARVYGLDKVQAGGNGKALPCRRQAVLGVAAARRERADRVAHLPVRDVGGHCRHRAGSFEAGQVGRTRRRCVGALPLRDVGPVDARGRDLDQDLAGLRHRHRPRRRHEDFGAAWFGDFDTGHRSGKSAHGRPFEAMGAMVGVP